MDVEQSFKKKQ